MNSAAKPAHAVLLHCSELQATVIDLLPQLVTGLLAGQHLVLCLPARDYLTGLALMQLLPPQLLPQVDLVTEGSAELVQLPWHQVIYLGAQAGAVSLQRQLLQSSEPAVLHQQLQQPGYMLLLADADLDSDVGVDVGDACCCLSRRLLSASSFFC